MNQQSAGILGGIGAAQINVEQAKNAGEIRVIADRMEGLARRAD